MTEEITTRDPEYLYAYRSAVREEYGLTDAMIDELGPPDESVPNPHYRCGPLASLYLRSRVEGWIAQNPERVQKAREHRTKCRVRSADRRASPGDCLTGSWSPTSATT